MNPDTDDKEQLDEETADPASLSPAAARVVVEPGRVREKLIETIEPVMAAHKCELVELDWRREPIGWVLRLYVEHVGHDPRLQIGGVGIDECARISRDVSMALDVADFISHAYNLEVSSPGLERPLTKPQHYRRFVGLRAKVRLDRPLDEHPNRKVFRGEILHDPRGDDTTAKLADEEVGEVVIPLDRIQRAALVYEPAPKIKPGKGKKGQKPKRDSEQQR